MSSSLKVAGQGKNPAVISVNDFKFKSLSNWSYNISFGCRHGCSFCYVPQTSAIKQEENYEKSGVPFPPEWKQEREQGQHWADHHWGEFCILRTWDEKSFLESLRAAEAMTTPPKDVLARWDKEELTFSDLNKEKRKYIAPDSNRAIMFCSTTDPYQTLVVPGAPQKSDLLNAQCAGLVTKALRLILEKSTLNVRILTRSPLARRDFPLFKEFGDRLVFGMSLPTLDDKLSQIYEPGAPGPTVKLKALKDAVKAGLHVYVALAPTLPDEGEAELRKTMTEIAQLKPISIFHEPINLRAENVLRIEKKARELGRTIQTDVFKTEEQWREYAFAQLFLVKKIAEDLKIPEGVLQLWPDKTLATKSRFVDMRRAQIERDSGFEGLSKMQLALIGGEWPPYEQWIKYWHNPAERISSWPGIRMPKWK